MAFPKSPAWLVQLFEATAPGERRRMFGCPVSFEKGQMFTGVFGDGLFVRLGEVERDELLAVPGARPFAPMEGRPSREYVVLPESMLEDEEAVSAWMERARAYAGSLPPKKPKKKKGARARAARK